MQVSSKVKTGAVIAAAGMSSRMGDFKPLLELGGVSFVRRTVANFKQAGVAPVVVVCGYRAGDLERHLAADGVLCVRNDDYADTEMTDSARIGLSYVSGKCDRAFFSPVDVPLVRSSTVRRMLESDAPIVRPTHDGSCGHPVLFSDEFISRILEASGADNLGGFLRNFPDETCFMPVADQGVLLDADTPEDYESLVRLHDRQLFRPQVDISLWMSKCILDSRAALLLRVIDYDGTVKDACGRLGISYRKAWNMIGAAEQNVGSPLVERIPGGASGGMSRLTPLGADLLEKYEKLEEKTAAFAKSCFEELFGDLPEIGRNEGSKDC